MFCISHELGTIFARRLRFMKALYILFFTWTGLAVAGCYYDTQEELYGTKQNVPCDTTMATYSSINSTIIVPNCNSCHSTTTAASSGGNIALDSYDKLVAQANTGKLVGDIKHLPGYNAMPQNGNKLSDCNISNIEYWIAKGTPNN
jgi:hypothetical protein